MPLSSESACTMRVSSTGPIAPHSPRAYSSIMLSLQAGRHGEDPRVARSGRD